MQAEMYEVITIKLSKSMFLKGNVFHGKSREAWLYIYLNTIAPKNKFESYAVKIKSIYTDIGCQLITLKGQLEYLAKNGLIEYRFVGHRLTIKLNEVEV